LIISRDENADGAFPGHLTHLVALERPTRGFRNAA